MDGEKDTTRSKAPGTTSPLLVCLLVAQNAADRLPDALDSMSRFADAVVALDDGSTDGTGDVLRSHPLVRITLVNRVRDGDVAGHEGNNRNRLLTAAAELDPHWVVSLDADEQMGESDAVALRRFLEHEALAGCAFGFQRFRVGPAGVFDPVFEWVYRLFPFRPGQHFATEPNEVVPVPLEIPTRLWLPTTLRIQRDDPSVSGSSWPVWEERPLDAPVLQGPVDRGTSRRSKPPAEPGGLDKRPTVVCMLPAHNAAHHLDGWFESVAAFADAVVALDDGSTDGTAEILERHPLVRILLRNPPREGYAGWNDSRNRNRLLEAAGSLTPDWVIGVDADELVPLDEGTALRRFIDKEAVPGIAYAVRVYRMIGDLDHYDQLDNKSALRLFAYRPGQVLSPARLHLNPAPTSIPQGRRLVTNIRFQHLNGLTPELRRARRQKYAEADPGRRWQLDYAYTDAPEGVLKPWRPRPDGLPVILEPVGDDDEIVGAVADEPDADWPVLTAIVIVDERAVDEMAAVQDELAAQHLPHGLEVMVLALGADAADDIARLRPGTMVIQVPERLSPGAVRNIGLRAARGDYVVFFDAPATLSDGALAALVELHDRGIGVVSGSVTNLTESAPGWASYLSDPAHCSFLREPLLRIGGFDERLRDGVEALARERLLRRGQRAGHTPLVTFGHRIDLTSTDDHLRQRYALGRALGRDGGWPTASWRRPPAGASGPGRVRGAVIAGELATWAGSARERLRRGRRRSR